MRDQQIMPMYDHYTVAWATTRRALQRLASPMHLAGSHSALNWGQHRRVAHCQHHHCSRSSCIGAAASTGPTAPSATVHSTALHTSPSLHVQHDMQLSTSLGRKAATHSWVQPPAAPPVVAVRQTYGDRRTTRATTDAGNLATVSARDKVLALLDEGYDNYNPGHELGPAVERLISSASAESAPARATMTMAHGTWEVFYAPHIAKMSSALGTRFQPIRYTLTPTGELVSNVRYSAPLMGTGWLSASGSMWDLDDATLQLKFDRFWVDVGEESLRPVLQPGDAGAGPLQEEFIDRILGAMGRVAFIKQLAVFPVQYLDNELAVFEFPPLKSNIAVRKLM